MDETPSRRAELADLEETAARITARAGELLLERYRRPVAVEFKDEKQTDPVTETDRAVERLVGGELRATFPDHGILGEEGTSEQSADEYLWVLDPLDGTANYAGHLPYFALSLALLRNGVPIVGCLFVPFGPGFAPAVLRCSYGNGARAGGEPLRLERRAFRPTGPAALPVGFRGGFSLRGQLARRPGELRNLGSICFEIAMVASGGFQYAAFLRPRLWDVAAGVLLVREAGGVALTWQGRSWRPLDRFVPPSRGRPGNAPTLRDWARPVLVGGPGAIEQVGRELGVRPPPPRALRWLYRRQTDLRRWWRGRRPGVEAAQETGRPEPGDPLRQG
jgi:myo-inositol-1(or 4)-monophosphatase